MINVVVVDNHPLFREALSYAITSDPKLNLVGQASDGREALALVHEVAPDVMVVDLLMPYLDGFQVLKSLGEARPGTRSLVLSATTDSRMVHRAFRAGADGFLGKDATAREIAETVVRIAQGEMAFASQLQQGLLRELRRENHATPRLSDREAEVLELVAEGKTNGEIAAALHLQAGTVKTYVTRLLKKLEVPDRTAAASKATRDGLLG